MTEQAKRRPGHGAAPPEDREGRPFSRVAKAIPPHPDRGDRPPCEAGRGGERPCKRDATALYVGMQVCDEHLNWYEASESLDQAESDVFHARRFLWRAQVLDVPALEHHITQALSQLEGTLEDAKRVEAARRERANVGE